MNAHTPIEKQSNQDWNTPIHLKLMVHIWKFFWYFGLLSWFSTYVFITTCGWNGYVCILEIVLDISRFPKYLWMFDTEWNAYQIDIHDHLFD